MAGTTAIVEKAKKSIDKAGDTVGANPKTFMYIGFGVLGFLAVRKLFSVVDKINPGNDPNAGGGNPDVNSGNSIPFGATITPNQAQNKAAALHQEMTRFWGTRGEILIGYMRGLTPKDFAMVSSAFGKPRYDDHGDAYWPFPKQPLTYWIHSELNDEEILQLKAAMPGVL